MQNNTPIKYLLVIFLLLVNSEFARIYAQKEIFIGQTLNGSQSHDFEARDKIVFSDGAKFKPDINTKLNAKLNEKLVFSHDFMTTNAINEILNRATIDKNKQVGSIDGSYAVLPSGQISYNIPIYTPSGTNGMQPSILINYLSQRENGVLGYGWDIAGLSSIYRSSKNIYFDGRNDKVNMDNNDALFLDGQRLILSNVNGQYFTEQENFSLISAMNTFQWFKVESKSGIVMEFGNTSDSRITNNGVTIQWKVNKIMDPNGNYMTFHYLNTGNEAAIDLITYTGNATAGIIPYNKIEFYYDSKPITQPKFFAGKELKSELLLRKIDVYSEQEQVRSYDFNYKFGSSDLYVKLFEVNETGQNNRKLNSTLIRWSEPYANNININNAPNSNGIIIAAGDANGDGKTDYISYEPSGNDMIYKLLVATDNNPYIQISIPGVSLSYINWHDKQYAPNVFLLDFDKDGKDEIYIRTINNDVFSFAGFLLSFNNSIQQVGPNNAVVQSTFNHINIFLYKDDNVQISMSDINGDAKPEVVFIRNLNEKIALITKIVDFSNPEQIYRNNFNLPLFSNEYLVDCNGDGKTEIAQKYANSLKIVEFNVPSQTFTTYTVNNIPIHDEVQLFWGDFNGDMNTDVIVQYKNGTTNEILDWQLYYSTGTLGIFTERSSEIHFLKSPLINPNKIIVGDFNADGKSDLLIVNENSNKFIFHYSNGSGFRKKEVFLENNKTIRYAQSYFAVDANVDGTPDLFGAIHDSQSNTTATKFLHLINASLNNVVYEISNGYNITTAFDYVYSFSNRANSVYNSIGKLWLYNNSLVSKIPLFLTNKVTRSTQGLAIIDIEKYTYSNPHFDFNGKGFIGFTGFTKQYSFGNTANIKSKEEFIFQFNETYKTLVPIEIRQFVGASNVLVSTKSIQAVLLPVFDKVYKIQINQELVTDHQTNVISSTIYNNYDASGNPVNISYSDGFYSSFTSLSYSAIASIYANKIISKTISETRQGNTISKSWSYTHDLKGNLLTEIILPGTAKSCSTITVFNNVGLPISRSISAQGLTSRIETFTYDANRRYEISNTNAIGQTTTYTFNKIWGRPNTIKGPDGLETKYEYDDFGNLIKETNPLGQTTSYNTNWHQPNSSNSYFYKEVIVPNQPWAKVYYDFLGRKLKTETINQQLQIVNTSYQYDLLGRLDKVSKPFIAPATPIYIQYTYDNLDREISVADPETGVIAENIFNNINNRIITKRQVKNGQVFVQETRIFNEDGSTSTLSDLNNSSITYQYYGDGLVKQINSVGAITSFEYDLSRQQSKLIDPNAGTSEYLYNAYGELIYQKDANGNEFEMTYDLLSRLIQKKNLSNNQTETFEYYNSGNGLNQLKNTNSFEGVQEQFTYNKYSQPIQVLKSISGQNFITSYTYDNLSRLKQTTYPGGYSIINEYDQFGFVTKIKEASTNKQLWQFSECNQNGQPTHELLNGNLSIVKSYTAGFPKSIILKNGSNNIFHMEYVFDIAKGNLTSRKASHIQPNILEEFEYDNMQRLTKVKVGNSMQLNSGFAPNGNIISKSNVSPDPYLYTGTPPHAVTGITNPINMPPSFTQTISYTPFQRVSNIVQGLDEIQFSYSSDGYRAKTITKHNNIITEEIYFAPNFEKIITTINKEINYIYSPNGLLGVMLKQGTTETFYYTYQDYLGNILALVDENGNVAEEYNFDAWGKRRNPQNWSYAGVTSPSLLNRGFTGHEHLDKFGLVNMNARLYDPLLGRMLSPDNFVQAPENTQSFNRYSYAWNNPLKYTDPDGNLVFGLPLLFWGIAAFTGVGSAMIMTGHSPSQTFNVAATIAVTVATAGLTSGIAASGALGNTSAIIFGSMVGSGTNYVTSGGKSDLTVSFGAASFNFSNNELGYLGKEGNSTWQNVGYGLGAFGNVVDLFGVINPQNSFHTLQTDNTDLKNGFDPGHSQFENQNGELSISFGPKNQRQNIIKKFLGSKGTNDYRSLHGMDINTELYNVGLNSKVVNTVNKISAKTPYSAALGIQCTGATTLTALLSGHFMPNIGLLTLNAPQFAHYTLMYERQIRTVSAFSSIYLTK